MPPLESRPGELPEPREECISLKYLLDANVLSDFARGHRSVTTRLRREAPLQLAFRRSPRWKSNTGSRAMANLAPRLRAAMRTLLDTISVVPFEREDARVAAQLRATLNSQGTPIGAHDLLLAACALRRGPVIVTHDAREFVGVGGLGLADWRTRNPRPQ